jgi:hypothetical protein
MKTEFGAVTQERYRIAAALDNLKHSSRGPLSPKAFRLFKNQVAEMSNG